MSVGVSVCIPVFNRKYQIANALNSALDQTFDDFEVVIVDNCSTDGTWEFLQTVADPRVRIFRNDRNVGMFGNFNEVTTKARGRFVVYLCSDDRLRPGFLAHAAEILIRHNGIAMVSSAARLEDSAGNTVRIINQDIPPGMYKGETVREAFFWYSGTYGINIFSYPSGIMLRKSAIDDAGPFRTDIGDPADVDMWIRCLRYGDFAIIHFVGCDVTWNDKQASSISRRAGKHIFENAVFAKLHLADTKSRPALNRYNRLLGASSFAWAAREVKRGKIGEALKASKFGTSWSTIIWSTFERALYALLAKGGIIFHSSLHKMEE